MLKANLDQQQKFEKRLEKLVMELHKQQLEFQQFTLQKTELQQKHIEELLVNLKKNRKNTILSQSTNYNSIDTFEYIAENDKTFEAFYRHYEDIFNVDCKQWPSKKKSTSTIKKTGNSRI